jgi:hypothetical protein
MQYNGFENYNIIFSLSPHRLRAENSLLVKRLVTIKEGEIARMEQINQLHEEAVRGYDLSSHTYMIHTSPSTPVLTAAAGNHAA